MIAALLAGIAFLHYFSPQVRSLPLAPYPLERHAVERIVFLLPVAVAALAFGQVGGRVTLALAVAIMLPRVFWISPYPSDALLETLAVAIVGYFVIWAIETQAREKRLRQELSQRFERAYGRLQTLYESAQTVNSTLELESVLDRLAQTTAQTMGVRACSIRLLNETWTRLTVAAVYGLSEAYVQKGDLVLEHNPLAREVLAGKVIAIGDVTTDGRLQYPAHAMAEGIRSMLSAPLLGKRGPLGLIRAYSIDLDHFTEDDAKFLTAIANQGSIAIENALAYQELSKLDRMKSKFVLTVTHELRSPLSMVRSFLRTLAGGYAGAITDAQRDIVTQALHRADLLGTLIDDLLALAAAKSDLGFAKARVSVCLAEAVERVAKQFEISAQQKQIKLEWHCEPAEKRITISAADEDIDRILSNLLSNAIKYTPSGGRVTVALSRLGGQAHLLVSDSGIGIPEGSLAHLFEEFYRAPNAKEHEPEGTGLGLAITKDLVTRYGGHISVQSKVGQGTTFTVVLPLME
ncbi:MAG: GAF domain-containing protein [Chloroflexota bacterium]|nr:GAF domain-containing protein [Chloroflexota bacterium]